MLKSGIFKNLWQRADSLITGRGRINEELFEEFEAALLAADVSVKTTDRVLTDLREAVQSERLPDAAAVRERLRKSLTEALGDAGDTRLKVAPSGPSLYLMVGVNGVGKTTTLGKMAYRAVHTDGKKVMLVAGDTFRAAAADQLAIWAQRAGADFIRQQERSDPRRRRFRRDSGR